MNVSQDYLPRRTVLAVPGSSERFIAKARSLPVDCLFLDLEDAVAPSAKKESRQRIVAALGLPFKAPLVEVRVNDWRTSWTYADVIETVSAAGDKISALILPKVQSADEIVALDLLLTQIEKTNGLVVGKIGIEAQIEDAEGLTNVKKISGASKRLRSLVFGPGDFMAAMGMSSLNVGAPIPGYLGDHFHYAFMKILVAARAHGLQAIDGPYVAIKDISGLQQAARKVAALGMDGKWVLHPDQINICNEVFTPSQSDFDRAQRIIMAYEDASDKSVGAILVDHEMVDESGVKLARAIMMKGKAAGLKPTEGATNGC